MPNADSEQSDPQAADALMKRTAIYSWNVFVMERNLPSSSRNSHTVVSDFSSLL